MNKRILICDDDESILDMLEIVLDRDDINISTELESLKVIDKLSADKPDLLIIDLWMPKLSGDQILKQIRTNELLKSLPVMVISASRDGSEVAMEAGADDYLAKPFDVAELEKKVEQLLSLTT